MLIPMIVVLMALCIWPDIALLLPRLNRAGVAEIANEADRSARASYRAVGVAEQRMPRCTSATVRMAPAADLTMLVPIRLSSEPNVA